MRIKMNALDTLFFKDGKPFSKGEENWSDGIFPPYPSVLYGALRTAFFSKNIEKFRELKEKDFLNTEKDPTTNLRITEISMIIEDSFVLPFPKDCLIDVTEIKNNNYATMINCFQSKGISSAKTDLILKTPENKIFESIKLGFISDDDLKDYLNSENDRFEIKYFNDERKQRMFDEPKIGIGRDFIYRTSTDSQLYRVDMKRIKDIQIVVSFEGLEIEENGLIRLGGEGKAVQYKKIESNLSYLLPEISKYFTLYLTTHSIFGKGWLPNFLDAKTLTGEICKGLEVKLISAIIERPINIGGFDMKKKQPKPMRKAVPAGSVYFFEIINGDAKLLSDLNGKSISDYNQKEGFGICYFGKSNKRIEK